jgi:uncharacterized protein (UPF0305 family)
MASILSFQSEVTKFFTQSNFALSPDKNNAAQKWESLSASIESRLSSDLTDQEALQAAETAARYFPYIANHPHYNQQTKQWALKAKNEFHQMMDQFNFKGHVYTYAKAASIDLIFYEKNYLVSLDETVLQKEEIDDIKQRIEQIKRSFQSDEISFTKVRELTQKAAETVFSNVTSFFYLLSNGWYASYYWYHIPSRQNRGEILASVPTIDLYRVISIDTRPVKADLSTSSKSENQNAEHILKKQKTESNSQKRIRFSEKVTVARILEDCSVTKPLMKKSNEEEETKREPTSFETLANAALKKDRSSGEDYAPQKSKTTRHLSTEAIERGFILGREEEKIKKIITAITKWIEQQPFYGCYSIKLKIDSPGQTLSPQSQKHFAEMIQNTVFRSMMDISHAYQAVQHFGPNENSMASTSSVISQKDATMSQEIFPIPFVSNRIAQLLMEELPSVDCSRDYQEKTIEQRQLSLVPGFTKFRFQVEGRIETLDMIAMAVKSDSNYCTIFWFFPHEQEGRYSLAPLIAKSEQPGNSDINGKILSWIQMLNFRAQTQYKIPNKLYKAILKHFALPSRFRLLNNGSDYSTLQLALKNDLLSKAKTSFRLDLRPDPNFPTPIAMPINEKHLVSDYPGLKPFVNKENNKITLDWKSLVQRCHRALSFDDNDNYIIYFVMQEICKQSFFDAQRPPVYFSQKPSMQKMLGKARAVIDFLKKPLQIDEEESKNNNEG